MSIIQMGGVMIDNLKDFIFESNRLECIMYYNERQQLDAYHLLFKNKNPTCVSLSDFGEVVVPENREPIPAVGFDDRNRLTRLLGKMVDTKYKRLHAVKFSQRFARMAPYRSCNNLVSRALWAWMMVQEGYQFERPFLIEWYNQTVMGNK